MLVELANAGYRTIVHRYVVKFTAAAPFRKAHLTPRRARITHAASPMLLTLSSRPAMIVVSFRPGEVRCLILPILPPPILPPPCRPITSPPSPEAPPAPGLPLRSGSPVSA